MKESRLYWRRKEGGKDIEFSEVPFTGDSEILYKFGKQYFKQRESKNLRLRLQGTRKLGCLAHISVKQYTLYPSYRITEDEKRRLSAWRVRQLREDKLRQLSEHLKSSSPSSSEARYYVSLPTHDAHSQHPTNDLSGYAQKVNPAIAQKISELVSDGITEVHEVKRSLRHYVHTRFVHSTTANLLLIVHSIPACKTSGTIYIYRAQKALELSKLDQENLRLKVQSWEREELNSSHFFRPYVLSKDS